MGKNIAKRTRSASSAANFQGVQIPVDQVDQMKSTSIRVHFGRVFLTVLAIFLVCTLGPGQALGAKVKAKASVASVTVKSGKGPPPHAPAHGYRRKFSYRYYPAVEVYHDVERGIWFYTDGKVWKAGAKLPVEINNRLGGHVTIELESESPEKDHERIREEHPVDRSMKQSEP